MCGPPGMQSATAGRMQLARSLSQPERCCAVLVCWVVMCCRSLTGINGSSEGIVGVLVRGDTASALNISLGNVQVGVRVLVSATGIDLGLFGARLLLPAVACAAMHTCFHLCFHAAARNGQQ